MPAFDETRVQVKTRTQKPHPTLFSQTFLQNYFRESKNYFLSFSPSHKVSFWNLVKISVLMRTEQLLNSYWLSVSVSSVYPWITEGLHALPFYIRHLSTYKFWYPWRSWNQSPTVTEGWLYSCIWACHVLIYSCIWVCPYYTIPSFFQLALSGLPCISIHNGVGQKNV